MSSKQVHSTGAPRIHQYKWNDLHYKQSLNTAHQSYKVNLHNIMLEYLRDMLHEYCSTLTALMEYIPDFSIRVHQSLLSFQEGWGSDRGSALVVQKLQSC